jgi:RNA polymerase sigma-70 factor (ECF subfamily)
VSVTDIAIPFEQPTLVQRAKSGDRVAFERLITDNVDGLLRFARSIVLDPIVAQDVVQEALIAAWRGLPRLRDENAFDVWVRRIVANRAKTHLAKQRRQPRPVDISGYEDDHQGIDLSVAIQSLEPKERALLALHYLEGRTVEECGYILAIPTGTVKSRLHTIRGHLREALGNEYGQD